jgi:hypothetical protein
MNYASHKLVQLIRIPVVADVILATHGLPGNPVVKRAAQHTISCGRAMKMLRCALDDVHCSRQGLHRQGVA